MVLKVLMAKKHKKPDAYFSQLPRKVEPVAILVRRHDPSMAPSTVDGQATLHYIGTTDGPRGTKWEESE